MKKNVNEVIGNRYETNRMKYDISYISLPPLLLRYLNTIKLYYVFSSLSVTINYGWTKGLGNKRGVVESWSRFSLLSVTKLIQ